MRASLKAALVVAAVAFAAEVTFRVNGRGVLREPDQLFQDAAPGTSELLAGEHCVTQLRTYRTTVSLLRGLCDDDLPAELRMTVQTFLEDQTPN